MSIVRANLRASRSSLLSRALFHELYEAATGIRLDLQLRPASYPPQHLDRLLGEAFRDGVLVSLRSEGAEVQGEQLRSTLARDQLRDLAEDMNEAEFVLWLTTLFGADIPESAYKSLRSALLEGRLPEPAILLVDGGLDGHAAAYDQEKHAILIRRGLVRRAREEPREAWTLLIALIEEFGHHIDRLLRTKYSQVGGDARLDEGARMAYALVNLGWSEGEVCCEFARYVTPWGEVPLEVEFSGLTEAVQRCLDSEELEFDAQEGPLEFFGAGRGAGHAGSYGHESIEDALEQADFDAQARKLVYFGNWLRDYSQVVDPKTIRHKDDPPPPWLPTRTGLTKIVGVLARLKFGDTPTFQVTPDILGLYRNEEHIDNPSGTDSTQRSVDEQFRGPCTAKELEVSPATLMKRFIRDSVPTKGQGARKHRVRDGDTLDSIARANGLTWQQLALHNFGTAVPVEVNTQLKNKVGCTKLTADGRNYIFTSQDQPGLIEIPPVAGSPGAEAEYTALNYLSKQLLLAVSKGATAEGYRHLGCALHTLEDYFSHSNFVEVALVHLGTWAEPWVPAPRGRSTPARELPITTGKFGSLDTSASILLGIGEQLKKEEVCEPGKPTAGSQILLILLNDLDYDQTYDLLKGLQSWWLELEKEYPKLATLSCETIGKLVHLFVASFGYIASVFGNVIDDAQTLFVEDPASNDPTHSQLAKDHDDHPLHELAAKLAAGAVLDVGRMIQKAWKEEADPQDVVATAAKYLVHPVHIASGGGNAWVLDTIRAWIPKNGEVIKRIGSRSWIADWTKERSKEIQEMIQRGKQLMGMDE